MKDPIKMAKEALGKINARLDERLLTWTLLPSPDKDIKTYTGSGEGMTLIVARATKPDGSHLFIATAMMEGGLIIKLPDLLMAKAWKIAEEYANNEKSTEGSSGFSA